MIRFEEVTRRYESGGRPALDDVTVEFYRGDFAFLIGASGSGKSTLLRCINGLERITDGTIDVGGERLSYDEKHLNGIRSRIGMVFQSFNLFPHMTVRENICVAQREVLGRSAAEAKDRAHTLLERVGLDHKADAYPDNLSGGQQQRVAIARALATAPDLVFADEPTGNLDSRSGREVLALLRRASADGQSIAMVTHDPVAASYADRVLFLGDGRVVADKSRQSAEQISAHMLRADDAESVSA